MRPGGETVIFIRHLELSSLSFRVLKLLRPPAHFLRSQAPVSRISQKLGRFIALPVAGAAG